MDTQNWSPTDRAHLNSIVEHYNTLHPSARAVPESHADNEDHHSMTEWVKGAGKALGITVSGAGAAGIALWLIKKIGK